MLKLRIFAISFLCIFFELVCMRWLPSHIGLLSYFTNFVMLGCFLGLGLGCLLPRDGKNSWPDLMPYWPFGVLALAAFVWGNVVVLSADSQAEVFFSGFGIPTGFQYHSMRTELFIPLMIIGLTLLFIPLGQELGRAFSDYSKRGRSPLGAYAWNLAGSFAGAAALPVFSFAGVTPVAWFALSLLIGLAIVFRAGWKLLPGAAAAVIAVWLVQLSCGGALWSPYYRIDFFSNKYVLVNGHGHQTILDPKNPQFGFYRVPYRFRRNPPEKVLILGAGTGNDVAAALAAGAKRVDAVEIDPVIAGLGRFHPAAPYSDPRVHIILQDARAYLERCGERYDMIIFGALDSLTALAQLGTVRLESYSHTTEAARSASACLAPGGELIFYNWYRHPWVLEKFSQTVELGAGSHPGVYADPASMMAVIRVVPPGASAWPKKIQYAPGASLALVESSSSAPATTDDWPFPYMKQRGIPAHYMTAVAGMLLWAAACVALVLWLGRSKVGPGGHGAGRMLCDGAPFFLLGAGFMLMETAGLVRAGLLFGGTWLVQAIVVGAILLAALAGNWLAEHFAWPAAVVAAALLGLLVVNYFGWHSGWPGFSLARRIGLLAFFIVLPCAASGYIFSASFRNSVHPAYDLGFNLFGGMAGGCLEYASMAWGYRSIYIIAAVIYVCWYFCRHFLETPRRAVVVRMRGTA